MKHLLVLATAAFLLQDNFSEGDKGKYVKVNVSDLDYDTINSTLYLLKTLGTQQRPSSSSNKRDQQYTCTLVVSEDELKREAKYWATEQKFPDTFTKGNRRVRTQYNSKDEKGGVLEHGEKIILENYISTLIANMQMDSRKEGYNEYPIVLMYSYFVPCTLTGHECARLLAEDKKKRAGSTSEYSMIIGFTQSYGLKKTLADKNLKGAFKSLMEADIFAYNFIQEVRRGALGFFVVSDDSINVVGNSRDIFQVLMYQCLLLTPVSDCCTKIESTETGKVYKIIAFFVNSMVYKCIHNSPELGALHNGNKPSLKKCFTTFLEENIGGECTFCYDGIPGSKKIRWTLFANECLDKSLKLAKVFGKSYDPRNPSVPGWTKHEGAWKDIARDPPNSLQERSSEVMCGKRILDPQSACTKSAKPEKIPKNDLI